MCFVEALWRLSIESQINAPSPVGHGWKDDMSVEWLKEAFPENVELLVTEMEEEIEDFEYVSREIDYESYSESE